ncbi:U-box domain-containing protein 44 [Morella rubra]|uniref:U-box domain-containing protein 44 n=1 Tax=Morella rubra TaxID=262757 RepID=A0A6A1WUY6_9ROSI|nr:U-box domain-containing protein 44 [Morella rubra]
MEIIDGRSFSELTLELIALADEVVSMSKDFDTDRQTFAQFALLVEKFSPILSDLRDNDKFIERPSIRKAVESLEGELKRSKSLIQSPNTSTSVKHVEEVIHNLGWSIGLLLFACLEQSTDFKEKIGELHKDLMNARFSSNSSPTSSRGSEFVSELKVEGEIIEEMVTLDIVEVALKLKCGNDEDFRYAVLGLNELIGSGNVTNKLIVDEGIITTLFNRLGSSKPDNRLATIQMLRRLALEGPDNKEKMADAGYLSMLVKSLTRDVEERREAVGLLLDLSDLIAVRRRMGRIQGCIVMLVAILNGDDPVASRNAGKLLNALSSNTQNALHMAEAGYFKPLVQYLKEGSDMSKILMATALSRMELTDQYRASLGEDGAIDPLVHMFNAGKLESKLSALSALQNLCILTENVQRLISSGIVVPLLQLLFSVTSVLMTLREPASAILAIIAQSESILVNQDVAQQVLSLINLSSPVIQCHLLQALNSIAVHSTAAKVRRKMKENGAIQLLLPFLKEKNTKIRSGTLNLIYTLSKDFPEELTEQLGETHIHSIIDIISSSTSEYEKAAAIGILSNLPLSDKKATDVLKRENLLPLLISVTNFNATSTSTACLLVESVAGVLIRFTNPSDKKLQLLSVEHGVIPLLVKLLSSVSPVAKCRAATSLGQLSQNTLSLRKSRKSSWLCIPPPAGAYCEVHDGYCFVNSTFCLVKAGAISALIQILEGDDRLADEAVLGALATLLQHEIWENGCNCIARMSGIQSIIKVLELGTVKAQEKALWILERILRVDEYRMSYGESAQVVLIDLAQYGDPRLKSTIAKLLAQLDLLQVQSSYF